MGFVNWLKGVFGGKKAEEPILVAPPAAPIDDHKALLAAELTARIEELWTLEKESVSDSLKGKYRARREEAEAWRDQLS